MTEPKPPYITPPLEFREIDGVQYVPVSQIEELIYNRREGTHYAGCWQHHHACAVARVYALQKEMQRCLSFFGRVQAETRELLK